MTSMTAGSLLQAAPASDRGRRVAPQRHTTTAGRALSLTKRTSPHRG
jgi:hypothetical protein